MTGTELITSPSRFDTMAQQWNELLADSRAQTLVLTHEWQQCWWRELDHRRTLAVICVYQRGSRQPPRLIGIAPFSVHTEPLSYFGVIKLPTISFIGDGQCRNGIVANDYLDIIARRGFEKQVIPAVFDLLQEKFTDQWQQLILGGICRQSPNFPLILAEAKRRGLSIEVFGEGASPYVRLPDSFEKFLKGRSANLRYQIRRGRKELQKLGGRYVHVETDKQLCRAMDALFELHRRRRLADGRPQWFLSAGSKAFYRCITERLLKQGKLAIGMLELKDRIIAVNLNFAYAGCVHFLNSGIQPLASNRLRPGMVLHSYCIERAIADGHKQYDFRKRGRHDYKDRWADAYRTVMYVRIAKPGLKNTTLRLLQRALDSARQGKQRLMGDRPLPIPQAVRNILPEEP